MKRVTVVAAALAAATAGGAAIAGGTVALAAPQSAAAHPATQVNSITRATTAVERASLAAGQQSPRGLSTANIVAQTDGGKYLTVVHCAGVTTPAPVRVGRSNNPLSVDGTKPSASVLASAALPNLYKPVYQCTVSIEQKDLAVAAAYLTAEKKAAAVKKAAALRRTRCEIPGGSAASRGGSGSGGSGSGSGGGSASGGGRGAAAGSGCTKKVTLNTGFGGMAGQVSHHHPAR